jgi:hypothetical protein
MTMEKYKDLLELMIYILIATFLITLSVYLAFTYPNTKPEPRFKNTLQRDINP